MTTPIIYCYIFRPPGKWFWTILHATSSLPARWTPLVERKPDSKESGIRDQSRHRVSGPASRRLALPTYFIFMRNRCARDLPPVTPEATMSRIRALAICSRISALFVRKLLVITRSTLDLHLGNCRRAKWFHLHISGHINDNM